jgi:hypothetical protein
LHGLSDRALGVDANQVGQLVAKGWIPERRCRTVGHNGILVT